MAVLEARKKRRTESEYAGKKHAQASKKAADTKSVNMQINDESLSFDGSLSIETHAGLASELLINLGRALTAAGSLIAAQQDTYKCGIEHKWRGIITKGGKEHGLQPPPIDTTLKVDEKYVSLDPDDPTLTYADNGGCLEVKRTVTEKGITGTFFDLYCCKSVNCKKPCKPSVTWDKKKQKNKDTGKEEKIIVGATLKCECPP